MPEFSITDINIIDAQPRRGANGSDMFYELITTLSNGAKTKTWTVWRSYSELTALAAHYAETMPHVRLASAPGAAGSYKAWVGSLVGGWDQVVPLGSHLRKITSAVVGDRDRALVQHLNVPELNAFLKALVANEEARADYHLKQLVQPPLRKDWPALVGPIDLAVQDLPHASSKTEWWYYNTHLTAPDGARFSAFVCFFRVLKHEDARGRRYYAHALNWAVIDHTNQTYTNDILLDKDSPAMVKLQLEQDKMLKDGRLRRAMEEILDKGNVPLPDRMFSGSPRFTDPNRFNIDYEGAQATKDAQGRYHITAQHGLKNYGLSLTFEARKPAIRHGAAGVVKGHEGDDMFYYFIPRCAVTGTLTLDGRRVNVRGDGWYDHEFGGVPLDDEDRALEAAAAAEEAEEASASEAKTAEDGGEEKKEERGTMEYAWNWAAVQLDNGVEVTAATLTDPRDGHLMETRVVIVGPNGERQQCAEMTLEPLQEWTSVRTFSSYPTLWELTVPEADIRLRLTAVFDDQEFITLIAKPAFWEGVCNVEGTYEGSAVTGTCFVEVHGYSPLTSLNKFFSQVGVEVRNSVRAVYPDEPTFDEARDLIASKETEHYMEGVPCDVLAQTLLKPVRDIADRGGKSWRSYGALACIDVVGGDSRKYVPWLALPEFMHVGSLIVDDIQDDSLSRRGGPCAHITHGVPLALNAGTAAYFQAITLVNKDELTPSELNEVYDLYFAALRGGHAGQALDIYGLDYLMDECVPSGNAELLETRILAVHRLKTAVPAGTLARIGALVGHGTREQIETVGMYFEHVGVAFQIMDDVLNLRGLYTNPADRRANVMMKTLGEDITCGKVTIPVCKAMGRLQKKDRIKLWRDISKKPQDPAEVSRITDILEECGAIEACVDQAKDMVETAWADLDAVVPDSFSKLMLRGFGWFVTERAH